MMFEHDIPLIHLKNVKFKPPYYYLTIKNLIIKKKSRLTKKKKGLNIALVPANMARLSFGPCKKKFVFDPCKIFCFLK